MSDSGWSEILMRGKLFKFGRTNKNVERQGDGKKSYAYPATVLSIKSRSSFLLLLGSIVTGITIRNKCHPWFLLLKNNPKKDNKMVLLTL